MHGKFSVCFPEWLHSMPDVQNMCCSEEIITSPEHRGYSTNIRQIFKKEIRSHCGRRKVKWKNKACLLLAVRIPQSWQFVLRSKGMSQDPQAIWDLEMGRLGWCKQNLNMEQKKLWVQTRSHLEAQRWSLLEIDLLTDLPPTVSHMWQKEVFLVSQRQSWLQYHAQNGAGRDQPVGRIRNSETHSVSHSVDSTGMALGQELNWEGTPAWNPKTFASDTQKIGPVLSFLREKVGSCIHKSNPKNQKARLGREIWAVPTVIDNLGARDRSGLWGKKSCKQLYLNPASLRKEAIRGGEINFYSEALLLPTPCSGPCHDLVNASDDLPNPLCEVGGINHSLLEMRRLIQRGWKAETRSSHLLPKLFTLGLPRFLKEEGWGLEKKSV